MGWLDKIMGKEAAPAEVAAPVVLARAPAVRDGIHHEIFIDDEPNNGRYGWLCRVYSRAGLHAQSNGSEESAVAAVQSASAWADSTMAQMRRAA